MGFTVNYPPVSGEATANALTAAAVIPTRAVILGVDETRAVAASVNWFEDGSGNLVGNDKKLTNIADPTSDQDGATKIYTDNAISVEFDFFFNNTVSDLGGIYYDMTNSDLDGAESFIETAGLAAATDDQTMNNFATLINEPGLKSVHTGKFDVHLHVEKMSGTSSVNIYAGLYKRATGGAETLIATTEVSGVITSKGSVTLHGNILADVDTLESDRIIIKCLGNLGAGSGATVRLYQEGTTTSHLALPTTTQILNNIYQRKSEPQGWINLIGAAQASTTTFTWTPTEKAAEYAIIAQRWLFSCQATGGGSQRKGYIQSAVNSSGEITFTVSANANLVGTDENFRIYPDHIDTYLAPVSYNLELGEDASNDWAIIDIPPTDVYCPNAEPGVKTAAAGAGAEAAFNFYDGGAAMFSSPIDLTTNNQSINNFPNNPAIAAGSIVTARITGSDGATNVAAGAKVRFYAIPDSLYDGAIL